jgi:acetyltransferase
MATKPAPISISDNAHYLAPLFEPRSVAIVGATEREGALGHFVLRNMLASGFKGAIYPVNPKHKTIMGLKTYAAITNIAEIPDLIIVASPAQTVADVLRDAGVHGSRAAVVLSSGFQEIGEEGRWYHAPGNRLKCDFCQRRKSGH